MNNLYIDDIRFPTTDRDWTIVRSSIEAFAFFTEHGCPEYISFDHDLGGEDTSMIIVKWMVERDLDSDGKFIPENFTYNVHSANPVGHANIMGYLKSYLTSRSNK